MDRVLLDTSAVVALIDKADPFHAKAIAVYDRLKLQSVQVVFPNFLLAESHTFINRRLGPQAARGFLNSALLDFSIEPVNREDELKAWATLQTISRSRDYSYFDAVAAAIAERLGIKEIFSFDRHFELLGLRLLNSKDIAPNA